MKRCTAALVALAVLPFVSAQQPVWAQCGGINWNGGTTCVSGTICQHWNDWYYQCIPAPTTQPPTTQPPTTQPPTTQPPTTQPPTTQPPTTQPPTTTPNPPTPSGFVGVSGQKFVLNGATFHAAGTNAYYLAQNSDADIDTSFADMKAAGLTFVRTWGFNDRTDPQTWGAYYQLFQNGQQIFNTGEFGISRFDSVVRAARASGIKLIVALTNNWSDYGGMDVYVQALGCGDHGSFYTNQKCVTGFQNYIRNFVGRYKDEPAIMAWELANEPRCGGSNGGRGTCTAATITAWAKTMSQFIKSIDKNHIVALGDEGFYQGGDSSGGYPYNANEGIDFVENLKIPTLDFGTVHMYPDHWGVAVSNAQAWGVKWIQDHAANQKSQNKPVIIEEFGILDNKVPVYTAWFDAVISSGLTGFAYWQAGSQLSFGPTHDDGYAVYPNTPVYDLVKTSSARLKARA